MASDTNTTEQSNVATKPKRLRWYQFSLRTLLIFMTVVAILVGTFVVQVIIPAERQKAAVAMIERRGGSVDYSDKSKSEWTSVPDWLRNCLGPGYFQSVMLVELQGTKITDAELERLQGLVTLQYLLLSSTQITDTGLAHLKGLTSLEGLGLDNTQITDTGLDRLREMTSLKDLSLSGTQITDAGLAHLKGLNALESLGLDNTQITDAGVAKLRAALPKLRFPHSWTPPPSPPKSYP